MNPSPAAPPGRPEQPARWYTKAEAAEALKLTTREIDRLITRGTLTRYRVSGVARSIRLDADAVDALIVADPAPEGGAR